MQTDSNHATGNPEPLPLWVRNGYPEDWPQISLRIRERDGWMCRHCGRAQGQVVTSDEKGEPLGRATAIKLACAHLVDRTKTNCNDENLGALCQFCHWAHDGGHGRFFKRGGSRAESVPADPPIPRNIRLSSADWAALEVSSARLNQTCAATIRQALRLGGFIPPGEDERTRKPKRVRELTAAEILRRNLGL